MEDCIERHKTPEGPPSGPLLLWCTPSVVFCVLQRLILLPFRWIDERRPNDMKTQQREKNTMRGSIRWIWIMGLFGIGTSSTVLYFGGITKLIMILLSEECWNTGTIILIFSLFVGSVGRWFSPQMYFARLMNALLYSFSFTLIDAHIMGSYWRTSKWS